MNRIWKSDLKIGRPVVIAFALIMTIASFASGPAWSADLILNEYNAVPEIGGFLEIGKSDSRLGRREGNGGDWFEWVVITDHLDMRGWQIVISHRTGEPPIPGPGQQIFNLTLSADAIWSDLRSGTIVTVAEDLPSTAGQYRPEVGEWWINVRATDTASGKYITPINFAVSNDKTQITFLDAFGAVAFGPSGEGISPPAGVGSNEVFKLEAAPTGAILPSSLAYTDGSSSSFGLPNEWTEIGGPMIQNFSALRSVVPYSPLTTVRINEVNVHSDPPEQDWIELYNTTGLAIDLGGWFLSDGPVNLMQFQIPPATMIPANGYLVFLQSALPFSLNGETGESVYLSEGDGFGGMTGGRDFVDFGPLENGVSFGRFPNASGPFFRMAARTEGSTNTIPDFGPIAINEIMYNALGPAPAPLTGGDLEYVELRNESAVDAPLSVDYGAAGIFSWRLSGALDFDFPSDAVIPANGFLLVVNFNPILEPLKLTAFRSHFGIPVATAVLGPNGGRLNNYSDTINLRRPDVPSLGLAPLVFRDSVTYVDFGAWPAAADGTGPSLERVDPTHPATDASRWAASLVADGSPGQENSVLNVPEPLNLIQLQIGLLGTILLFDFRIRKVGQRRRRTYSVSPGA